jgi:hypothetical protein
LIDEFPNLINYDPTNYLERGVRKHQIGEVLINKFIVIIFSELRLSPIISI